MAIREGAWDCPFCEKMRNRGSEKFCGGCGSPRGPEVKFYLPEDARIVEDAAEIERARAGPDWTCPFCGGDNRGWNGFCTGCGSARDAGQAREVVQHAGEAPRDTAAARAAAAPPAPAPPPPARASSWWKWVLGGCGGCGALLALLMLVLMFAGMTHDERLQVTGAHWERAIAVERLDDVQESAWRDEVPAGARKVRESREVRSHKKIQTGTETRTRTVTKEVSDGTERVKVGTRDMGNGYFEDVYEDRPKYRTVSEQETYQEPLYREEPVYDTRVTYVIQKWHEVRKAQASGEDTSPAWPDPRLANNEREGARTETYTLQLKDDKGQARTYEPKTGEEFAAFRIGGSYRAKVDRMGKVSEIQVKE